MIQRVDQPMSCSSIH